MYGIKVLPLFQGRQQRGFWLLAPTLPSYESDQLISIIGNKRSLGADLKLLFGELQPRRGPCVFLDPFCGSGAVARLARALGMHVKAGDNQPFSFLVNYVYLTLTNRDLTEMFKEMGGIDAYFSLLNLQGLYAYNSHEGLNRPYLSRYYAPQNDWTYDAERERLFFSAANARFFDSVRHEIEEGNKSGAEKAVLITALLYEASRKANTSGSFTAYHREFSSRKRLTSAPLLRVPVLVDEPLKRGEMSLSSAQEFLKGKSGEICYLDPPSGVQQYGNNYHLLNTITMWDNFIPPDERDSAGRLLNKGGIRDDWQETYSPFCSLKEADMAFVNLFGLIDARHIVMTYPAKGILTIERLYELLEPRHRPVTVVPIAKRNQGGRQSYKNQNIEYLFITGKKSTYTLTVERGLDVLALLERLNRLTSAIFSPPVKLADYPLIGGVILDGLPPAQILLKKEVETLQREVELLEEKRCLDIDEGLKVLVQSVLTTKGSERGILERRLYSLLRRQSEIDRLEKVEELLRQKGASAQRLRLFVKTLKRDKT